MRDQKKEMSLSVGDRKKQWEALYKEPFKSG